MSGATSPRISLEPEVMVTGGDGHHDITLAPNVAYEFRESGRTIPYVLVGVGWMHSRFSRFTTDDIFVNGGFGVKLFLTEHIYFAPEIRTGWEPHVRPSSTWLWFLAFQRTIEDNFQSRTGFENKIDATR